MNSPADSTAAPRAPRLPYGWGWMQFALFFSGLIGLVFGLWKSSWWASDAKLPPAATAEVRQWWEEKARFKEEWRVAMGWTNIAHLSLAASLLLGATLMSGRFAGLRFSMVAAGWFGIAYALVGSSIAIWYISVWANWADQMPAAALALSGFEAPSAATAWFLVALLSGLAIGKLLLFTITIGYFGRFDVRAYLEDPPEWFFASTSRVAS